MKKFNYYAPTEIEFGPQTESKTGELVKKYGGSRVFVCYGGKSAERSGLIDRVKESLSNAGIDYLAMGGIVPNPLVSKAREMSKAAVDFKADFVLAVGGGSVIDTAKGIALVLKAPEHDVWEFWDGTAKREAASPIGCVLTIAAAGSEMSNSTVLTNDTIPSHTKRAIQDDMLRCKFAIMNPELTMTLPVYQIGAGAADIFMHTSERYFAPILGNSLSDEIAEGLFRDIIKFGPKGVADPTDYEAMSEIMWCGSISHVGLTGIGAKGDTPREGDWACHQLGMAASAIYDSTHGATLSAVWATWAHYVMDENLARFARFARKVYGVNIDDDRDAAEAGIAKTNEFFAALGMPLNLTQLLGHTPTEDEIVKLADECSYGRTRKIGGFKVLDYDDMIKIYHLALK